MHKSFKIIYTTDPLCSFCWAIEPQITKLRFKYDQHLDFEIVMGGLLESEAPRDLEQFQRSLRDITQKYQMPIYIDDHSFQWAKHSLLACQLYLLIKDKEPESAPSILRKLREYQMLLNRDISDVQNLRNLLVESNLAIDYLDQLNTETAERLLYTDFGINRVLDASLYPTLSIIHHSGHGTKLEGYVSFEQIEETLLSYQDLEPQAMVSLATYLTYQDLILLEEIQQVYDLNESEVEHFVKEHQPAHSEIITINTIKALKKVD